MRLRLALTSDTGGFDVTDRMSPSRVATYLTCPRQFEFKYEHRLQTEDRTDMERYFNRGNVLDTSLQETAKAVLPTTDTEAVRTLAREEFEKVWAKETTVDSYPSAASYEYDRQISKAAIEDYLDPKTSGEGVEHLRRSVGTEVHLKWVDPELGPMHGYADNIVETRDGLLIIDYKASYSGRRFPNKSGSDLVNQMEGKKHYPKRLNKWLQIEMYCAGVEEHEIYSAGDEIRFMFYGLINSKTREATGEGYSISVSGKEWEMTDLYRSHKKELRSLLSLGVNGIRNAAFDPTEQSWSLIQEESCESCDYRRGCGDYLAEEVRFS